jgi:hypothetical protein
MVVALWTEIMKRGLLRCPPRSLLVVVLRTLALILAISGVDPPARAGSLVLPSGLKPGDTFQLAFVTDGTYSAESSDIAAYNGFVSDVATAAGLNVIDGQSVTWSAIGSTSTVDARGNAPQTAPVYDLKGQLITATAGGLWTTGQHFLDHPIDVTESGSVLGRGLVWTGTQVDGSGWAGLSLGTDSLFIGVGDLTSIYPSWISTAYFYPSDELHIYALSSPILVSVPEPSALGLCALGFLSFLTWRSIGRRRRGKGSSASRSDGDRPLGECA